MINLATKEWQIDNIETILFDKDGTFIDLHYFWGKMTELRASAVIKKYNLHTDIHPILCKFLGYDTKTGKMLSNGITALYSRNKIIEIFEQNLKEIDVFTQQEELTNLFDEVSQYFYKDINKYTLPINSAISFIKELHQKGLKLGIVTSDSIESTNLTLKQFGWEHLFKSIIGRESSPHTKESGEPTKLALKELNANPKTTLMIGDAPMDYTSAKNAGIDNIILVSTGQLSKKELLTNSKYVINSLDELKIL